MRILLHAILFLSLIAFSTNAAGQSGSLEKTHAGQIRANSKDGLTYVWIPPGNFQMGCSPGDSECFEDQKPTHPVTITKGFWIGQTLVTQFAYRKLEGANPSNFHGDPLPVEEVSWYDAKAYCADAGMRLPTEAEWEYAARAGETSPRYAAADSIGWHNGNSGNQTHPAAQKQPNAWKLYDMMGDVWEWTADWYDERYYRNSPAQNPPGPSSGRLRVLRGGSWANFPSYLSASFRFKSAPGNRYYIFGFRCAGEALP